jgi:Metal binding domain of Ada
VIIQQMTREVKPGNTPPPLHTFQPAGSTSSPATATSAAPWWQPGQTGGSPVGTVFTPTFATPPPRSIALSGAGQALNYAFIGVFFVWIWLPVLRAFFSGIGLQSQDAAWTAVLTFAAACALMGYRRAKAELQTGATAASPAAPQPRLAPVTVRPSPPVYPPPVARPSAPARMALVGSRIRMIYHKPHCRWAQQISFRNRVQFSSVADARASGYKPCGVCSP